MLVLTRRPNEKVIITIPPSQEETVVVVTYVSHQGPIAKLGFDAPKDTIIHRQEVQNAISRSSQD